MTRPDRAWSAICRYPGKAEFYFGTVLLPLEAMQHEVEAALLEAWAAMSPHPAPSMIPTPGLVVFQAEEAP